MGKQVEAGKPPLAELVFMGYLRPVAPRRVLGTQRQTGAPALQELTKHFQFPRRAEEASTVPWPGWTGMKSGAMKG